MLDRKALLAKQEVRIEKVELEGGDVVYVREMSGAEKDWLDRSVLVEKKDKSGRISFETSMESYRAKLAVCTICDDKGNLLLTAADVDTLNKNMSASRLNRITTAASRLNAIEQNEKDSITKN